MASEKTRQLKLVFWRVVRYSNFTEHISEHVDRKYWDIKGVWGFGVLLLGPQWRQGTWNTDDTMPNSARLTRSWTRLSTPTATFAHSDPETCLEVWVLYSIKKIYNLKTYRILNFRLFIKTVPWLKGNGRSRITTPLIQASLTAAFYWSVLWCLTDELAIFCYLWLSARHGTG